MTITRHQSTHPVALREYLQRKDVRARRLAETQEALADLEAKALLEGDEVLAWVEGWGTDHEREPPR